MLANKRTTTTTAIALRINKWKMLLSRPLARFGEGGRREGEGNREEGREGGKAERREGKGAKVGHRSRILATALSKSDITL